MLFCEVYKNEDFDGNWWIKSINKYFYKDSEGKNSRSASSKAVD